MLDRYSRKSFYNSIFIREICCICIVLFSLISAHNLFAFDKSSLIRLKATNKCVGCDLSGADLSNLDLRLSRLRKADLTLSNLSGAKLYWADMYGAKLTGADLRGADFSGANLYSVVAVKSRASGAIFRGTDLRDADFRGADLEGANFSPFDLIWYWETLVAGATFGEANLVEANLTDLDLRQTIMEPEQIERAILCRTKTKWGEINSACNLGKEPD